MSFRISALPDAAFAALFALDDALLAERDIRRLRVQQPHSTPCRVGLVDAEVGDEVLLLPFEHHAAATPYRSSGPIYVRRDSRQAELAPGAVPGLLRRRLLGLRAYRADGWLLGGDVLPGEQIESALEDWLQRPEVAFLHLHYARTGCYACRVDPA